MVIKENAEVDWDKLRKTVRTAIKMQDNVIDKTHYFLDENKKIDSNRLSQFRKITKGYELIFHRAFDHLINQDESLELLIKNKFDRILCSGSVVDSENGLERLKHLKKISNERISIMPGGGVNLKNFNLFKDSNFREIHLSAIDKSISLDSNYNIIREIVEMSK